MNSLQRLTTSPAQEPLTVENRELPSDHVKLPIRPPRLFVLTFASGVLFEMLLTGMATFQWPGYTQIAAAMMLMMAGFTLAGWSFATLNHHHTSGNPQLPTQALVTSGPYRWSRNPVYLAMLVIYTGATLLIGLTGPLWLLPLLVWFTDRWIIQCEERYLASRFADEWPGWCQNTRRWL